MTRLAAIADRIAGQAFGLTNYNQLEADVNYLAVAGANLASAATINPTNEFHLVTGTTTIDNITDALGQSAGQQVRLLFQSPLTIRNSGGGGNIRTLAGVDRQVQANEIVAFVYDGALWREVSVNSRVVGSANGLLDVVSSTTETDLLNFTLLAGALGPKGFLDLELAGDHLNNNGGGTGWNLRCYLGATKVYDEQILFAASATRQALRWALTIGNLGTVSSQFSGGWRGVGNAAAALTQGLLGATVGSIVANGTSAVDTSVNQTVRVTIQHNTNSATLSVRRYWALATIL